MKKHSNILLIAAVLSVSAALTFWPEAGRAAALRPSDLDASFLWRAFSCHFVHWSIEHWLYDAACFVMIIWRLPIRKSLPCLVLSSIAISIAVTMAYPWMTAYGGLSGVNCALYAAWAFHVAKRSKIIGCLALAAIIVKTALEIHAGHTFFVDNVFIPADMAHVMGIVSGVICGIYGNRLSKEIDIAHNEGKFQWS